MKRWWTVTLSHLLLLSLLAASQPAGAGHGTECTGEVSVDRDPAHYKPGETVVISGHFLTGPCGQHGWQGVVSIEILFPDGQTESRSVQADIGSTQSTFDLQFASRDGSDPDFPPDPVGTYTVTATATADPGITTTFELRGIDVQTSTDASETHDSATLSGQIVEFSTGNATVSFEWWQGGATPPDSVNTAPTTDLTLAKADGVPQTFQAVPDVSLAEETQYSFRAVATDQTTGLTFRGSVVSFTTLATPPVVVITDEATGVGTTSATLRGTLDNLGAESEVGVFFRYDLASGSCPAGSALSQSTATQSLSATGSFDADLTGLDKGKTYCFQAAADADPVANGAVLTFTTIDDVAPSAPGAVTSTAFPPSTDGWSTATSGPISWEAATDDESGVAGYTWAVDGSPSEDPEDATDGMSASLTGLADGSHTFSVRAFDKQDNFGPVATYDFQIDATDPTPATISSSTHPDSETCHPDATADFEWTPGSDGSGSGIPSTDAYEYQIDSEAAVTTSSTSATVEDLSDGTHTFTVTTFDEAGNSASDTYTFKVDLDPPTVTLSGPEAANDAFEVSWTGTDSCSEIDSYTVEMRKGEFGSFEELSSGTDTEATVTPSGGDGLYQFRAKATDALGHEGAFPSEPPLTVLFDTTPPDAPTGVTATPSSAGAIDVRWEAVDDGDGSGVAGYHVYRATSASGSFTKLTTDPTSAPYRDPGANTVDGTVYHYKVSAVDEAGNEGEQSAAAEAEADHASAVHVATPETVAELASLLGITLDGQVKATDDDGDGRIDTFESPGTAVLAWVAGGGADNAVLISAAKGQRPTAIWFPATDEVFRVSPQEGTIEETRDEDEGTVVVIQTEKNGGWIEIAVVDPRPADDLVRVERADGTVIASVDVLREGGSIYVLDDPTVLYHLVFATSDSSDDTNGTESETGDDGSGSRGSPAPLVVVVAALVLARRLRA